MKYDFIVSSSSLRLASLGSGVINNHFHKAQRSALTPSTLGTATRYKVIMYSLRLCAFNPPLKVRKALFVHLRVRWLLFVALKKCNFY